MWGASSTPGPNAPLGNLCGTSSLPQYSAQAALAQRTAAGFPASKLVLGLPLYGYVSQSTKTTLQQIARPPAGFDPVAYKEQVLPKAVKARVSVEAGVPMCWRDIVGDAGKMVSIDHFGASAAGAKLFEEFGFTPENVVAEAKKSLAAAKDAVPGGDGPTSGTASFEEGKN